jgi:REP element-mobilizing transposase RayT
MSRPLRIEYPDAWYHVMNRGRRKEKIFLNAEDYKTFLDILIEACELWDVNISAYSLMPNHYHLLINTPKGNLSRFMRHINGVYTQRFNKIHKYEGQLFRGRYKSILVDGDEYLLNLVRYIHNNPLRSKIVKRLDDFKWSSHQGYISLSRDWDWLHKDFILSLLTEDSRKWLAEYREFINQEDERDVLKMLEGRKWPAMYGSDEFIFTAKENFYYKKRDKEVPESLSLAPDIDRIKNAVCKVFNVDEKELSKSIRGVVNKPRNIAIYLTRQLRNDTLEEIGKFFSHHNYSSVSNSLTRAKKLIKDNPALKNKLRRIEEMACKSQRKA